jgi:hypothetical protein
MISGVEQLLQDLRYRAAAEKKLLLNGRIPHKEQLLLALRKTIDARDQVVETEAEPG